MGIWSPQAPIFVTKMRVTVVEFLGEDHNVYFNATNALNLIKGEIIYNDTFAQNYPFIYYLLGIAQVLNTGGLIVIDKVQINRQTYDK